MAEGGMDEASLKWSDPPECLAVELLAGALAGLAHVAISRTRTDRVTAEASVPVEPVRA